MKKMTRLLLLSTLLGVFMACGDEDEDNTDAGGSDDSVGCQEDAFVCPDGVTVGRTGPDCEFDCTGHDICMDDGGPGITCPDGTDLVFECAPEVPADACASNCLDASALEACDDGVDFVDADGDGCVDECPDASGTDCLSNDDCLRTQECVGADPDACVSSCEMCDDCNPIYGTCEGGSYVACVDHGSITSCEADSERCGVTEGDCDGQMGQRCASPSYCYDLETPCEELTELQCTQRTSICSVMSAEGTCPQAEDCGSVYVGCVDNETTDDD